MSGSELYAKDSTSHTGARARPRRALTRRRAARRELVYSIVFWTVIGAALGAVAVLGFLAGPT